MIDTVGNRKEQLGWGGGRRNAKVTKYKSVTNMHKIIIAYVINLQVQKECL
jgi:hypothetical protein